MPVVNSLKQKSNKISYYIASHYKGNEEFKKFSVPANKQFSVNISKELDEVDIFFHRIFTEPEIGNNKNSHKSQSAGKI